MRHERSKPAQCQLFFLSDNKVLEIGKASNARMVISNGDFSGGASAHLYLPF
jgi:hypothetical protein